MIIARYRTHQNCQKWKHHIPYQNHLHQDAYHLKLKALQIHHRQPPILMTTKSTAQVSWWCKLNYNPKIHLWRNKSFILQAESKQCQFGREKGNCNKISPETSKVPPPRSKTRMVSLLFFSKPYARLAAVGSLMIRKTSTPAIRPASLVAVRCESLK